VPAAAGASPCMLSGVTLTAARGSPITDAEESTVLAFCVENTLSPLGPWSWPLANTSIAEVKTLEFVKLHTSYYMH